MPDVPAIYPIVFGGHLYPWVVDGEKTEARLQIEHSWKDFLIPGLVPGWHLGLLISYGDLCYPYEFPKTELALPIGVLPVQVYVEE